MRRVPVRGRARRIGMLALAAGTLAACGGSAPHRGGPTTVAASAASACSSAVANAPALRAVPTAMVAASGPPFGIATASAGLAFVAAQPRALDVFSDAAFVPRLVRHVVLPLRVGGLALTHDGRELLVTDDEAGAMVLSVAGLRDGERDPLLGRLRPPSPIRPGGAIEVATSLDDRFAFVSVEYGSRVAVYDLRAALADHFRRSPYVGSIPLGFAVVGQALSPDGRWLYVTSEVPSVADLHAPGTLSVIDVATAERDPAASVVARVAAGCQPVRVAVSPDGRTVWVSARASDRLLAFSASRLRAHRSHALVAAIRVGEAPVGLALLHAGAEIAVADSNRNDVRGRHASLTIVDARAALAGRPALLGTIPTGTFPREMALEPGGRTLLVGNFGSSQLEAVDVALRAR